MLYKDGKARILEAILIMLKRALLYGLRIAMIENIVKQLKPRVSYGLGLQQEWHHLVVSISCCLVP
jgi:hypothetical protein